MSCPYPALAADSAAAIVVLAAGAVAEEDMQAAEAAQQGIALALDLDDRGRIASHSMFVVVLVIPAEAGVVAVLRFPMSCSKC